MLKLNQVQLNTIKEGCPECKSKEMHGVPNPEETEMYLWCDNCSVSMDSSGGWTA